MNYELWIKFKGDLLRIITSLSFFIFYLVLCYNKENEAENLKQEPKTN